MSLVETQAWASRFLAATQAYPLPLLLHELSEGPACGLMGQQIDGTESRAQKYARLLNGLPGRVPGQFSRERGGARSVLGQVGIRGQLKE